MQCTFKIVTLLEDGKVTSMILCTETGARENPGNYSLASLSSALGKFTECLIKE